MCPFCFSTLALVAVSATSATGLAALAAKLSRKKNGAKEIALNSRMKPPAP